MKVIRPSKNRITGPYTPSHRAYDFSGNPNDAVISCKKGTIVKRVDRYVNAWRNLGKLTTRDYGNYIEVRHDDGTSSFYAHLKKGSSFVIGTKVRSGQTIARKGNTGNSTGKHLHFEFKDKNGKNIRVEFVLNTKETKPMPEKPKIDPLKECLAQHTILVNEANLKDQEIDLLDKDLTTKSKQLSATKGLVTTANKKLELANIEIRTLNNEKLFLNREIAELKKPKPKPIEAIKDPMRYVISMGVAAALTYAYSQFPVLGELAPDQQALAVVLVGLVIKGMDKYQYENGSKIKLPL